MRRSQLCSGYRAVVSLPIEIIACIFRSSGSSKDALQGSIKARSWDFSTLLGRGGSQIGLKQPKAEVGFLCNTSDPGRTGGCGRARRDPRAPVRRVLCAAGALSERGTGAAGAERPRGCPGSGDAAAPPWGADTAPDSFKPRHKSLVSLKARCRPRWRRQECWKMLKLKAFCLDYWQFLCLQPLHGFYKR